MKRSNIALLSVLAAAVLAMVVVSAPVDAAGAKARKGKDKGAVSVSADKAIAAIDAQIAAAGVDKKVPGWKQHLPKPKVVTFETNKKYFAHMTTNVGTMVIEFKPQAAPMHVTSFIYLARLGFYDGLKFHRVIKGFMAQGGDPIGNGTGNPGYQYATEVSPNAKHDKVGVLSTANAGPDTDGSQFFIMFAPSKRLDGQYSVFGQVVEGLDVVKALEDAGNPGDGPPLKPLTITSVTIDSKPADAK